MNEISPVQARFLSRDAKAYARELVRKSSEALQKTIKEYAGFAHMASADLGGGLVGWSADVGFRYATVLASKPGDGIRGWIARHASLVSGSASGAIGTVGYVANALTNTKAPLSWWREAGRAAAGTLSMFGVDRALTNALGLPKL